MDTSIPGPEEPTPQTEAAPALAAPAEPPPRSITQERLWVPHPLGLVHKGCGF